MLTASFFRKFFLLFKIEFDEESFAALEIFYLEIFFNDFLSLFVKRRNDVFF